MPLLFLLLFTPLTLDINSLLTTALSIVSIATLAGLGLLRGTVTNLRENLKDSREEIADKERRMTDLDKTIATQKSDLAALGRVVTGEAQIAALGHQVDALRKEIKDLAALIRGNQT